MDSQQRSIVRQTRSMTRAAAEKVKSNLQANAVRGNENSSFEATLIDSVGGDDYDCVGCDRPNNAELYMVQCKDCNRWYHFSCGKVTTATVHAAVFSCELCVQRVPVPPSGSCTGQSSRSSGRRAQISRELERLEEEKRLMDEMESEQLAQEQALLQKARLEKIERTKRYIAKKYDLRSQQDEQEGSASVCSFRSNRMSKSRVGDWIQTQREVADNTGLGMVGNISELPSADSIQPSIANPVERHHENFSSTPLAEEVRAVNVHSPAAVLVLPQVDISSIIRKTGNTNRKENAEENSKAGIEGKSNQNVSPIIPPVDVQPLLAMLDEARVRPSMEAVVLKNTEIAASYEHWRQQRMKRELELAEQVRSLETQRAKTVDELRDEREELERMQQMQTSFERQRQQLAEQDSELRR